MRLLIPDDDHEYQIEELLHRRSDLSTFLVHYTRDYGSNTGKQNLLSMLIAENIEARSAYGIMKELVPTTPGLEVSQRCVCFTETPLEHSWMMCRNISGRNIKFRPYGIAFTKAWARRKRVNPVWYIDQTPTGYSWLTNVLNDLVDLAVRGYAYDFDETPNGAVVINAPLLQAPITRIAPFIEQMMTTPTVRKEFWWEREWRHVGDLAFPWSRIVAAFAPENEHEEIRQTLAPHEAPHRPLPKLLDPNWGLERMIAKLADVPDSDAGPFPSP